MSSKALECCNERGGEYPREAVLNLAVEPIHVEIDVSKTVITTININTTVNIDEETYNRDRKSRVFIWDERGQREEWKAVYSLTQKIY